MIAVLSVVKHPPATRWARFKARFHPYEITAGLRKHRKTSVLQVKYEIYRGGLQWQKLLPYLAGCRKQLLCDPDIDLSGTSFTRFENTAYTLRLMQNFVVTMLEQAAVSPHDLKIAYYDPMAVYPEMVTALASYTSCLTIVTDMPRFYENQSDRLMSLYGIPLSISNCVEALAGSDLILSTEVIDAPWPLTAQSIVFTVKPPLVSLKGTILSDYRVDLPYPYQRLKPPKVNNVYFLSALYSLCGVKDIEKLVPYQCSDRQSLFTSDRLSQRLRALRQSA